MKNSSICLINPELFYRFLDENMIYFIDCIFCQLGFWFLDIIHYMRFVFIHNYVSGESWMIPCKSFPYKLRPVKNTITRKIRKKYFTSAP